VLAALRGYARACKSYAEALAVKRQLLPKNHPNIARNLYNLGQAQFNKRSAGRGSFDGLYTNSAQLGSANPSAVAQCD
jgi:hypothetical protein